jgi:hypothetical protein
VRASGDEFGGRHNSASDESHRLPTLQVCNLKKERMASGR